MVVWTYSSAKASSPFLCMFSIHIFRIFRFPPTNKNFCVRILLYYVYSPLIVWGIVPSSGWKGLIPMLIERLTMIILIPRFIMSVRELYAHDLQGGHDSGSGSNIDIVFELSALSHPGRAASMSNTMFTETLNNGMDEEIVEEERVRITGASGEPWYGHFARNISPIHYLVYSDRLTRMSVKSRVWPMSTYAHTSRLLYVVGQVRVMATATWAMIITGGSYRLKWWFCCIDGASVS